MNCSNTHRGGNGWERWRASQDAALAFATLALRQADVAGLSPAASPRVLHLPVLVAVVDSVTDDENTMVEIGTAEVGLDNTSAVELEDSVCLNSNRDWSLGSGFFQSLLIGINISITSH